MNINTTNKQNTFDKIKIAALVFIIIFGGVIKTDCVKILGITPTLYRVAIPVMAGYFIIKRLFVDKIKLNGISKMFIAFTAMMLFWIIYGTIGIFVSPYSSVSEGAKEILSLLLGLLSVYCIYECCYNKQTIDIFLKYLKIVCMTLCILAIFEMFTGIHFPTSQYSGVNYTFVENKIVIFGLYVEKIFPSTSIFYGVNDFSVLISILMPLFYINKSDKLYRKIIDYIFIFLIVIILSINDANIALAGAILGLIVYTVLEKRAYINGFSLITGIFVVQQWLAKLICKGLVTIKGAIWPCDSIKSIMDDKMLEALNANNAIGVDSSYGMSDVLAEQIHNAASGGGSLFYRIELAIDSLELTLKTYGLGVGPGGFMAYFKQNPGRTYLVNPHNWWLEILSQYGIFVFVAYVGVIVNIYVKMIKLYMKKHVREIGILIAMATTFVISCMAPSSFLGYSYQWIIPAVCLSCITVFKTEDDNQ